MHIITGLGVGGAETALLRLIENTKPGLVEHHVVSLGAGSAMVADFERAAESLLVLNWKPALGLAIEIMKLRRAARSLLPDVIVGWMYHGNLAASFAAAAVKSPSIWNIRHSLYEIGDEPWLTRMVVRAGRLASTRPQAIIYNSTTSASLHGEFGFEAERARVFPNGFDTVKFAPDRQKRLSIRSELGLDQEDRIIANVARFHPVKDHFGLLVAASLAFEGRPNVKLLLVGKGLSLQNHELRRRIEQLNLTDRVILCGLRQDIDAVYAAADIAVSASLSESFPNTVAEAMAAGCPCIATDVGDVRQILGDTGLVVEPGNPEAMANALRSVLAWDVEKLNKQGRAARRRIVEKYSVEAMANRFNTSFLEVSGRDLCVE